MGQMDPLLAQFIRSSTFEITNSAVFDKPSSDPGVEGRGGLEYGDGEENDSARVGMVVWIEAAAAREWDARRCD
nr:hypothetical protein [Tanacetum cinerariifolium]